MTRADTTEVIVKGSRVNQKTIHNMERPLSVHEYTNHIQEAHVEIEIRLQTHYANT